MDKDNHEERSFSGITRKKLFRLLVLITAGSLVLPGIVLTAALQRDTARFLCDAFAEKYAPQASTVRASFNFFGSGPTGWNCYAQLPNGVETPIAHLGVIPGSPTPREAGRT